MIPPLEPHCGSWIIVRRATGEPVLETFERATAERVNQTAYAVFTAARELGVSYSKIAMAVAWGDAWTNLIQPFWALPALAVAGLGIRDIMGFCLVSLIFSGVVISIAFLES